jgi:hypothetical protein
MEKIITNEYVVSDFELILGLDSFYREQMQQYETKQLLPLVIELFEKLGVSPKKYPMEGYYYKSEKLKNYFNYIKTLREVSIKHKDDVQNMLGYKKLTELFCSGLYGKYEYDDKILPNVKDPIYYALESLSVENWNVKNILNTAHTIINDTNNTTIIGLGIIIKNPVIVTALRETAVLYADILCAGVPDFTIKYINKYIWNVSKEIEHLANIIIETFNGICPYKIPLAIEKNAKKYYDRFMSNPFDLRCVRIGYDAFSGKNYHWAIKNQEYLTNNYKFAEFWDEKHWTTEIAKNDWYRKGELKTLDWHTV